MAYRILSMDGGGAWALIEVRALMALHGVDAKGHDVLAQYDLVAANSGGTLVLGGLVENLTLNEIASYFRDETKRRSIFSPTKSVADRALSELTGFGPKYDAAAKLVALEHLLPKSGNVALDGVARGLTGHHGTDVHLLIVSFDYDRNRAQFFRSAPAGAGTGLGTGAASTVTLAEAIHASTNAPVNFFDGPALFPGKPERYWDGGITGCNNPVLAAVTEALTLDQRATDVSALSVGTATVQLPLVRPVDPPGSPFVVTRGEPGLLVDLRKLATAILDDPPDAASFIAYAMTSAGLPANAPGRVVRISPVLRPVAGRDGAWVAPGGMSTAQFKYLTDLGMDAVEQTAVTAIENYAALWLQNAVPNQAIRANGQTLKAEIGYDRFDDAVTAWNAIR